MGCCSSRERLNDREHEVNIGHMGVDYFQKNTVDASNYICQQLTGETVVKEPGQLNGQAFHIEECKDCTIVLADHTAAVTIDVCTGCHIFIGPCKGSIFIRESNGCNIMGTCQQFRARDILNSSFNLHCTTQPVIENCSGITFNCFNSNYPQLKEHLKAANLSPFNNSWYSVHDFTPQADNWTIGKGWSLSNISEFPDLSFNTNNSSTCIIPITVGTDYKDEESEICIVVFLEDNDNERASRFLQSIGDKLSVLVTKDSKMKANGLQHFFTDNSFAPKNLKDGLQVECLVLQGNDCISICSQGLLSDAEYNNTTNSYSSPNSDQAIIDYQRLRHLIDNGLMS